MFQKDFFLGVIVTILLGAVAVIGLLIKENQRLKSYNASSAGASTPPEKQTQVGEDKPETGEISAREETPKQDCPEKKYVYPDSSGIPIDWWCSVYKQKNDWVNGIATANLLQVKLWDLGDAVLIANCKFIDKRPEGFRLILEDPYETIRTELIPVNKIPEDQVDTFVGKILIVDGVSKGGKFKVKRIRKSHFAKKII